MNDARKAREVAPPTPPRAERRAAALVAQYIHELSGRHASDHVARRGDRNAVSGSTRLGRMRTEGMAEAPGSAWCAGGLAPVRSAPPPIAAWGR